MIKSTDIHSSDAWNKYSSKCYTDCLGVSGVSGRGSTSDG